MNEGSDCDEDIIAFDVKQQKDVDNKMLETVSEGLE